MSVLFQGSFFLAVFVGGCGEAVFLVLSAEQNVGIGLIYYLGAGVWEERVHHGISLGVLRCGKIAHTKAIPGIFFPMFSVSLTRSCWRSGGLIISGMDHYGGEIRTVGKPRSARLSLASSGARAGGGLLTHYWLQPLTGLGLGRSCKDGGCSYFSRHRQDPRPKCTYTQGLQCLNIRNIRTNVARYLVSSSYWA